MIGKILDNYFEKKLRKEIIAKVSKNFNGELLFSVKGNNVQVHYKRIDGDKETKVKVFYYDKTMPLANIINEDKMVAEIEHRIRTSI